MAIAYYNLPEDCARGLRREVRGHIWGLFALAREIARRFAGELTPAKQQEFECWVAYFFSKVFSRPLPKDPGRLRGTLEGQMYSEISKLFHDDRARKFRDHGKSVLKDLLRKKDIADMRRASEHIEDAMGCYEQPFSEAHAKSVILLGGGFSSGKK